MTSTLLPAQTRDYLAGRGFRSLLVLPLIFGDEVLGALTVRSARPFGAEEIRFCKVVAGASANAIKNALLYREMTQKAEQNRQIGEKLRRLLDCTPDGKTCEALAVEADYPEVAPEEAMVVGTCTLDQIISMVQSGLKKPQVMAACGG